MIIIVIVTTAVLIVSNLTSTGLFRRFVVILYKSLLMYI